MTPEDIARVCHEANRGYQAAVRTPGIPVAPPWDDFSEDQRVGVIAGVEKALAGATPEELHLAWCTDKFDAGWTYGPVKNTWRLTHPCLVPYAELPAEQRRKDELFRAIVGALGADR